MERRSFLIGAGGMAVAGAAQAQTGTTAPTSPPVDAATPAAAAPTPDPAAPPVEAPLGPPKPGTVRVNMQTGEGLIILDLEQSKAPATVANFLRYVDARRFDATTIYRASKPAGTTMDYGVVQGGYRGTALFPPVKHESTNQTGLSHTNGAISMGRVAPGSARADWFICVSDQLYLDATKPGDTPRPGDDGLGFACFGYVVQGMDIIRRILNMPTGGRATVAAMQGQMLTRPIPVTTVRRAPAA